MTTKDYELIAEAINQTRASYIFGVPEITNDKVLDRFIEIITPKLRVDNQNFNETIFKTATEFPGYRTVKNRTARH